MRILLIFLFISSIAYAREKDLVCDSLQNNKINHFILAKHYKCVQQDVHFEKISLKPFVQFSILKSKLFQKLKLNNLDYNVVGFKTVLGQTFKYTPLNNNATTTLIYKKEDQIGNIKEIEILILRKKQFRNISFIKNIFKLNLDKYVVDKKDNKPQLESKLIDKIQLISRYVNRNGEKINTNNEIKKLTNNENNIAIQKSSNKNLNNLNESKNESIISNENPSNENNINEEYLEGQEFENEFFNPDLLIQNN